MAKPAVLVKRFVIFAHRWMGVALALLFGLWFSSGIVMMYWTYPGVDASDRLAHSPVLDPAQIQLSPQQAFAKLGTDQPPDQIRLNTFDGRPAYRFRSGRGESVVYADTGEQQIEVPRAMVDRVASNWAGLPVSGAAVSENTDEDQWTVAGNFRRERPLLKYSFPDGQQVYVSENSGEVVQYTTTVSRFWAYMGAIPHWLYFTQLRKHGQAWSQFVIWTSGIGTLSVILGMAIGIWMYSPKKMYQFAGEPSTFPYRGQKRWHMILGLIFGLTAATWAFSGMMSMEPFPSDRAAGKGKRGPAIAAALRGGRLELAKFESKNPRDAVEQLRGDLAVKELELALFAGEPVYLATDGWGGSRVVPMSGPPATELDRDRIIDIVKRATESVGGAEVRVVTEYDRYYLDRQGDRPLPVIYARLNDEQGTRYYIDPKSGRVVGTYSGRGWVNRWLYHGLHSLDFPWLYKYRPLWDIVVLTLLGGGLTLCVTSIILGWRVLSRKLGRAMAEAIPD